MRLLIRTQGIDLTEQLCEHIQNRVRFALSRLGQNIQLVHVHLRDEDGPRGGVAERCTLRTQVAGRNLIIARTHSDIRTAVSVASDRLGDAARRALARSQSVPR